jgi:hypothetical protein
MVARGLLVACVLALAACGPQTLDKAGRCGTIKPGTLASQLAPLNTSPPQRYSGMGTGGTIAGIRCKAEQLPDGSHRVPPECGQLFFLYPGWDSDCGIGGYVQYCAIFVVDGRVVSVRAFCED